MPTTRTPKKTATVEAQRENAMLATRAPGETAMVGPELALAVAERARGALGASAMLALQNAAGNRAVVGLGQMKAGPSATAGAQAMGNRAAFTMGNRDEAQPRGEHVDGDSASRAGGPARLTGFTLPADVSRTERLPPRPLASAADDWQEVPHRAEMETAFGADFSHVKASLGRGPALDGMGARAATDGEHVLFAATQPSKQVVAHELAHVAQWQQAGGAGLARSSLSGSNDPAEREADAAAQAVAGGGSFQVSRTPSSSIHLVKAQSEKDVIERIMQRAGQIIARLGGVLEEVIPGKMIMLRPKTGRLAFLYVDLVEVKDPPVTLVGDTLRVSTEADIDDDGVLLQLENAVVERAQAAFSSSPQQSAPTVTTKQTEDKESSNLNEKAPQLTPLTWIAEHLPRQIIVHQQRVDVTMSGETIHLSQAQTNKKLTLEIQQNWMPIRPGGITTHFEDNRKELRYSSQHDIDKWDPGFLVGSLWYAFKTVHPLPARSTSWEVAPPSTKEKDREGMRAMPKQEFDGEWQPENMPPSLDQLFAARQRTQNERKLVGPAVTEEEDPIGHARSVITGLTKGGMEAKLRAAIERRREVLEKMIDMFRHEDEVPALKQGPSWNLLDNLEIEDQLEDVHIANTRKILEQAWTKIRSMLEPQVMALVPPCTVHINGPNNPLQGGRRAEYDDALRCIHIEPPNSFQGLFPFFVHEFTHHLEYYLPNSVWATVVGLLQHRSDGAPLQPPGGEHNRSYPEYKSSKGGPGGTDNYANLFYSDGGTEVLTRAIEYATRAGIEGLVGDPELCILLLRAFRPTLAQQIAAECGLDLKIPPSMLAKQ